MFGLMRAKKCGMSADEKEFRRLHYCGTCKTAGALYSQKSRLLLNHDTVFLAEILSSLNDKDTQKWQKAYQSYNCLSLPKNEIPLALKFAATANVVLTEFKIADHFSDTRKRRYRLANKIFSDDFRKASRRLDEWNFPLDEVKQILSEQEKIEAEALESNETSDAILESLAAPTATTTALFFAEGVKLVGKGELEDSAFNLGFAFGKLIYLVDAFEDYEKDFHKSEFNAFRAAFGLKESKLTADVKRKITTLLRGIESEIVEKIYQLPIAENQKTIFASRLTQNLQRKLKTNLPVMQTKKSGATKTNIAPQKRWQAAKETARNLARTYGWQMPFVFLFIFAFALIAPAQSREAKSARECFDLSFNLMTLGAIFGAVLAAPLTIMQNLSPEQIAQKAEKKHREGWCDWCHCDCCECCCCCDSCDCSCD